MNENKQHWRVEKKLDLSMIMSALAVMGAVIYWGAGVDKQFAEQTQIIESVRKDIQENRNYILRVEGRMAQ